MAKKKSNKLLYILISLAVVLIITAVVGKKAGWIGKTKEIEVELVKVSKTTIEEKVSASGTVQPVTEVKISPDVSGEIIELYIEEGDSVIKDQLLLKIRPDIWINAVERATANLNQQYAGLANARARRASALANYNRAKYEFARSKELKEGNVISEADYELADANFKVAENDLESAKQNVIAAEYTVKSSRATLDEAEENLRKTSVYAPMTGTVSKLDVELGERVVGTNMMTGTEMLRIADLNKMEVRVDVNENDIIRVSEGDTADIDVDSYTYMDIKFEGVVTAIANTANDKISADAVTEFEVKVLILNESYQDLLEEKNITSPFRPGMTASVDVLTETKMNVLAVPLASVTTRHPDDTEVEENEKKNEEENSEGDNNASREEEQKKKEEEKEVVFVNDNGTAKKVEVVTGISDYDNIEILEGLEEGQEVVTGPFVAVSKRLKGGEPIKTMDKDKKKKKEPEKEEETE
ncbi:efflux RND transporter periplasmic adaptor subunit [Bacteroidota bacterium]